MLYSAAANMIFSGIKDVGVMIAARMVEKNELIDEIPALCATLLDMPNNKKNKF